jgi:hypothetical protein
LIVLLQENVEMARHWMKTAAGVYKETGPARAIDMMERAVNARPSSAEYRYLLAKYQHETGIKRAAVYNVERALSIQKNHKKAKQLLQEIRSNCESKGGTCLASGEPGEGLGGDIIEPSLELAIPIRNPLMMVHRFDVFTPEEAALIVKAAKVRSMRKYAEVCLLSSPPTTNSPQLYPTPSHLLISSLVSPPLSLSLISPPLSPHHSLPNRPSPRPSPPPSPLRPTAIPRVGVVWQSR